MSAVRSVLLIVIGAAVGTILSDLLDLGWVAPVVVLIIAGAGLAYVEMNPTARKTDLLRTASDARLAGRKIRGEAGGTISASSGGYHRLREEIITWTRETYKSLSPKSTRSPPSGSGTPPRRKRSTPMKT